MSLSLFDRFGRGKRDPNELENWILQVLLKSSESGLEHGIDLFPAVVAREDLSSILKDANPGWGNKQENELTAAIANLKDAGMVETWDPGKGGNEGALDDGSNRGALGFFQESRLRDLEQRVRAMEQRRAPLRGHLETTGGPFVLTVYGRQVARRLREGA